MAKCNGCKHDGFQGRGDVVGGVPCLKCSRNCDCVDHYWMGNPTDKPTPPKPPQDLAGEVDKELKRAGQYCNQVSSCQDNPTCDCSNIISTRKAIMVKIKEKVLKAIKKSSYTPQNIEEINKLFEVK